MAKVIATIGGVALVPGISKNRRWYKPAHIAGAVAAMQERIRAGTEPISMMTHHQAGDDSRQITATLTSASLDEDGALRWSAGIADTPGARVIANLADTSDGEPAHLEGVSIRGWWTGTVRTVKGPDGEPCETADGLIIDGLDFTKSPGVTGARIDTFAWTNGGAQTETTERVPITESVQEARVTAISEETAPASAEPAATEAAAKAQTDAPAGTVYADPGYLDADGSQTSKSGKPGVKRYPLNGSKRIRAAWSYINQKDNAAQYTANQLKRIKDKIKAAMKKIGATVSSEGWAFWPAEQVTEAEVREWYGDYYGSPQTAGSWSICASNGPVSMSLSSYNMDPADLDLVLRAAADAACKALAALDPDMDGDVDVPPDGTGDTDHDGGDESAPAGPASVAEATEPPAPLPAAGDTEEQEGSPMTETTAAAAETSAPAVTYTQAQLDAITEAAAARAVTAALAAMQQAQPAAAPAATAPAASAPGPATAPAAEATPAAPVTETREQRIDRLVAAKLAEAFPAETEDQQIARLVAERYDAAIAAMVQSGQITPGRKGIVMTAEQAAAAMGGGDVINEATGFPASWGDKKLHEMSLEELTARTAPVLGAYVFGDRAGKIA